MKTLYLSHPRAGNMRCKTACSVQGCLKDDASERWSASRAHEALTQARAAVQTRAEMLQPPAAQLLRRNTRVRTGTGGAEGAREGAGESTGAAARGRCQFKSTVRACSCGCVLCFVICVAARILI